MPSLLKVRKVAKIRNRYNQVPHLTQDTTWESDKNQINIKTRDKRLGDHKPAMNRRESMTNTRHKYNVTQINHKRSTTLEQSVNIFYFRALTGFTAPTSPLVQMWIKTHRCLDRMKDAQLINASSPRLYISRYFLFDSLRLINNRSVL